MEGSRSFPLEVVRLRIYCTLVSLMARALSTAVSVICTVCCVTSLFTPRLARENWPTPKFAWLDCV